MQRFLIILICCTSLAHATTPVCFQASDLSRVNPSGWRIYQGTSCPASDTVTTYKYFPETICSPVQMPAALTSTWDQGSISQTIWANRWSGGHNQKPNPPSGAQVLIDDGVHGSHPCFLAYSSQAYANAATQSEIAYAIGRFTTHNNRDGWLDYTRNAGLPDTSVYEWSSFVSNASILCATWNATYSLYTAQDIVVEPSAKLADVPTIPQRGIKLDYEPQDSRSASDTNAMIFEAAHDVHGKLLKFTLYTNPLDGIGGTPYNGIGTANVNTLLGYTDDFGIFVTASQPVGKTMLDSLNTQMAMFASPDYSKFNLMADMTMSPSDAATMHDAITNTYPFGGVDIVTNGQSPGGSCSTSYNLTLSALLGMD